MLTDKIRLAVFSGILALIGSTICFASTNVTTENQYATIAVGFISIMSRGDFAAAEANFTDQMKETVTSDRLKGLWDSILSQAGAFEKTAATKTIHEGGYTTVIVNTTFKNKTIGFAVTFDDSGKIGGLHLVPAV